MCVCVCGGKVKNTCSQVLYNSKIIKVIRLGPNQAFFVYSAANWGHVAYMYIHAC